MVFSSASCSTEIDKPWLESNGAFAGPFAPSVKLSEEYTSNTIGIFRDTKASSISFKRCLSLIIGFSSTLTSYLDRSGSSAVTILFSASTLPFATMPLPKP